MNKLLKKINMIAGWILVCISVTACHSQEETLRLNNKPENVVTDRDAMEEEVDTQVEDENIGNRNTEEIYVYVTGQVKSPGVYALCKGDRVYMAIEAAGGFTDKASKEALNLADAMTDGEHIHVLSKKQYSAQNSECINSVTEESGENQLSSRIDINSAGKEELMMLPGIGESKAEAIISYREDSGRFQSIEDIMNVTGIKEGAFAKIKDKITV